MPKHKAKTFQRSLIFTATATSIVLAASAVASAATANTTVNVDVNSTIGISSSGIVNLTVTPTSGGSISSGSDTVRVTTSDSQGYTLSFSDADSDTTLSDGGSNSLAASNTTPGALDDNSWGYRVDGLSGFGSGPTTQESDVSSSAYTWAGVPALGDAIDVKNTSTTATNDQTVFWYAVKADQSIPSGTYSDVVTYTATAN